LLAVLEYLPDRSAMGHHEFGMQRYARERSGRTKWRSGRIALRVSGMVFRDSIPQLFSTMRPMSPVAFRYTHDVGGSRWVGAGFTFGA